MKKIILSIACILVTSSLFAQEDQIQHELTVNLGGGISALQYKLESGKNTLGLGGSVGLGYTYFFNNQFGINTGVEANFYQSEYSNEALVGNYRIADTFRPGYFQLDYEYNKAYNEKQNALFLQIPLMLQFQTEGYHKFYAAAGGRVGFPVYTKFNTDASALAAISGTSEFGGEDPFEDLPQHGFTHYETPKVDGKLSLKTAFMASLELGMKWALNDNMSLYTGVYGDYGLNDIQKTKDKGTIIFKYDDPNQDFLAFGNSVTSTSTVEKITPLTFGVKLRLAFGLGETMVMSKKAKAIKLQEEQYYQAVREEASRRAEAIRLQEEELAAAQQEYLPPVESSDALKRLSVTDNDMRILMEPIWGFDITKTVLTPEMKRILDRKIPILKKYWYLGLVLEGHTCDIGSDQINDKFGYERAQAVKAYFVSKGLESTRFSTISKGKYQPAVRNDSEEHRKRNRRVQLSIKK